MPDASHDFGAHLRQAREQRGIPLRAIADRTKISVLVLEALERNDVSRLPGGIFTRAFVRAYAAEVGLDPEDTVHRFLARFPDDTTGEESPRAYEPNPEHIEVDERPTFGRAWRAVVWAIPLLAGVAYFGFGGRLPLWGERAPQASARPVEAEHPPAPPAPSELAVPAPAQPGADVAGSPQAAVDQAAAEGGQTPSSSGAIDASQPPAAGGAAAAPLANPAAPAGAAAGVPAVSPDEGADAADASTGAFRMTLAPREACWVSVRANGATIFSGLMQPGERRNLAVRGRVSLTVGNAGAFDYFLNDQPGRSLGTTGQVATVLMTAENLPSFVAGR